MSLISNARESKESETAQVRKMSKSEMSVELRRCYFLLRCGGLADLGKRWFGLCPQPPGNEKAAVRPQLTWCAGRTGPSAPRQEPCPGNSNAAARPHSLLSWSRPQSEGWPLFSRYLLACACVSCPEDLNLGHICL